jgi:WD40 repeat protein
MFSKRCLRRHDTPSPRNHGMRSFRRTLVLTATIAVAVGVFSVPASWAQEPIEFKGHKEVVYDGKFLPDGKSLVTASFDQTLKLWDIATQSTLRTMEGHTGIVLTVDVSPDGKLIASGSSDRTIRLWDVPNSDPVSTTKVHDAPVTAMASSNDGSLIATADGKGLIRVWTTAAASGDASDSATAQSKPAREMTIGRAISRLAWMNDNKKLAAGCGDGAVVVVSLAADGSNETDTLIAHDGEVTGVGFTPNNQHIFSCGADGYVRRWPTTIPATLTFTGLAKPATAVAIHPNGTVIAVVGKDGEAKILKRADGAVVHSLDGKAGSITDVTFNRAGSQVATISSDQVVRVYDASTGKPVIETAPAKSPLTSLMFSIDGKEVIVGTERGDIFAHSLGEPAGFRSLSKRPQAVRASALTSDGARLIFAGDDKQLWIRESATGKTERGVQFDAGITAIAISQNNASIAVGLASGAVVTVDGKSLETTSQLAGHTSAVQKLAFNTSGTQLISAAKDSIRLWDLNAQAIAQTFSGGENPIVDFAFQSDNKSIVTAHADGSVRVETITAQIVHRADDARVNDLSIASNGSQYATAGADGTVKLWNASNSTPKLSFTGFEGPALCVNLSPDNRQVAAGGSDKTVRTWNVSNSSSHFRLNVAVEPHRVSYSPDSSRLVAALTDNTLRCFDPTPLNPQPAEPPGRDASQTLRGHTATIADIAWTPDSQSLRTCSADTTLREWSIASPKEKAQLSGHSLQVYSVVFSPDGKTIASASADKTVRLWDVETRKAIKTLTTFPSAVYGLDFSSDGGQLIASGADSTVRLLDVSNGRTIRQFDGPEHAIYTVTFSPDNSRIAAAGMGLGSQRNVYLWSIDSSQPTAVLQGHDDDIYQTQFNSTGSRLMSIGYSGSLRIWDVETSKPLLEQSSGIVSYSGTFSPNDSTVLITSNDQTARLVQLPDSVK